MGHNFSVSILLIVFLYIGSTISRQESQISVYWNVPTNLCKKHNEHFEKTLKQFNIIHNAKDEFKGEMITIFYKPGQFPTYEKDKNNIDIKINGGIPQLASIDNHLIAFEDILKKELPSGFSGIGVIDFEDWRPIFRQNWNKQVIYKNLSIEWAQTKYLKLFTDNDLILEAAKKDFEEAAIDFMEKTLEKAKFLFPKAFWGYYGFPHCYNHYSTDITQCAKGVTDENDRIHGIFDKSNALFPSIYMNKTMIRENKKKLVIGRIKEAKRVWRNTNQEALVLPYMWVRYLDLDNYLSEDDIKDSLEIIRTHNARGVIIWGRSEDVNSKKKCQNLHNFLKNTVAPAIRKAGI